jgi:hypothetical protein
MAVSRLLPGRTSPSSAPPTTDRRKARSSSLIQHDEVGPGHIEAFLVDAEQIREQPGVIQKGAGGLNSQWSKLGGGFFFRYTRRAGLPSYHFRGSRASHDRISTSVLF